MIVRIQQELTQQSNNEWFMGQVIFCEEGARNPKVITMFQVANIDYGHINWLTRMLWLTSFHHQEIEMTSGFKLMAWKTAVITPLADAETWEKLVIKADMSAEEASPTMKERHVLDTLEPIRRYYDCYKS